ncbi:hypothetical protein [Chondromyces crocatus]|uniref:Uncharacterized protein n=1 Tax=Chondromyces crocatus TaxID=52 RepID=A0A0K1EKE1_CHOCO|nr:hypothetical protein [Chondromyces crocatus]AKT41335.1 uncharacterized protein CMC5_055340 [Chondromyces crocatus]
MSAHLLLFRVLTTTAARAAAPSAVPLYLGLLLVLPVLFGPNGLRAETVTRAAQASPALALGLLSMWLLLTAHVARAVVELPEALLLRALPVHRGVFLGITGLHLAVIHAPWGVLWGRGEGGLAGMGALAVAVGLHGLLLARSSRLTELAAAVVLVVVAALPGEASAPLAALVAPLGVMAAWRRAPERTSSARGGGLPHWAPAALAVALLRVARRAEPGVLLRGMVLALLGGLVTPFAIRGHDVEVPAERCALSLQIAGVTLAVGGAGIGAAVLRAEQAQAWLLDALGVSGGLRTRGAAGASGVGGALLGWAHGGLTAFGLGASPTLVVRLVVESTLWGASLGVMAVWHAREALVAGPRRDRVGSIRVLLLSGLTVSLAGWLGEVAIVPIAGLSIALAALSARKAAVLPPPRCARNSGGTAR